ncbi:MAG: hypothetical protein ACOCZ6_04330 [Nanoarchaeota archaeon]
MQGKKATLPMYVIVSLIIALVALLLYSFFAQGIIYDFMQNLGAIEGDINESMQDALDSEDDNGGESQDEGEIIESFFGGFDYFEKEKEGL